MLKLFCGRGSGLILLLSGLMFSGLTSGRAQGAPGSGQVVIPARGLFSMRDGTVEAWVRFNFDPSERVEGYTLRGQLFTFQIPKAENDLGAEMSISFSSNRSGYATEKDRSLTFLRAGFVVDGKQVPHPLLVECPPWKRNEWHHFALTWKEGRRMTVYFDGKVAVARSEAARMEFPYSTERDVPAAARFILGSIYDAHHNAVVADEVRISSVARTPEQMGVHQTPLQSDPFTLLLLDFDTMQARPDGSFTVRPSVIASGPGEEYVLTKGGQVPGKAGSALAFSTGSETR